jgi:NADH dehydrogenase
MTTHPAQRLNENARPALLAHFLALASSDRRLRFGTPLAEAAIAVYVDRIDFDDDAVFGVHDDDLALIGVAHIAFDDDAAELGVSVSAGHRNDGVGSALFERATEHARNRFVPTLFMHCLAENAAMMHIARRSGMDVVVDMGEAQAHLRLPPASPASRASSSAIGSRSAISRSRLTSPPGGASARRLRPPRRRNSSTPRECSGGIIGPPTRFPLTEMPESAAAVPHRIVVVGGGAGGLPLATKLGDTLGRRGRATVTLVDRLATHLWKPLLHEIAAGRLDANHHDVDYFLLAHWHHFRFRLGAVAGLDRARELLALAAVKDDDGNEILPPDAIPYDTLVLAVGSVGNDFGIAGVAEHAIPLDTPEDAERFHRRLVAASLRAEGRAARGESPRVDIAIIGAGATGVELAAEIRHTTRAFASYGLERMHPERDIAITIVEAAPRILPLLPEKIAVAATELLAKLDVAVRTNERVTAVDAGAVHVAGGNRIPADLVVWAAGIKAPPILATLDLEVNRANQLVVDATLATTRDTDVFALGDCAACPWPEAPQPGAILPPRAQVARQQATFLAKNFARRLDGKPLPAFRFTDFGSLVSLGELSAVGNLMGRLIGGSLFIQGLIARWMYASLYKMHQVSIHGVAGVVLDTMSRLVRHRIEPRVKLH